MSDTIIWAGSAAAAVSVVGVAAIFALRPALIRLLDRTKRVGKDGATFEQPQERGQIQDAPLEFKDLMRAPVTASVLERENHVLKQFQSFNLKTDTERIQVLIRVVASTRITMEFVDLAHTIFGSQVRLLVGLTATTAGITTTAARTIYDEAVGQFPALHTGRAFETWLGFIQHRGLIVRKEEQIDITQYGSDFMKYLVDARLTHERRG